MRLLIIIFCGIFFFGMNAQNSLSQEKIEQTGKNPSVLKDFVVMENQLKVDGRSYVSENNTVLLLDSVIEKNAEGVNMKQYTYDYDKWGNQTLELIKTWEKSVGEWGNWEKLEVSFDEKGNETYWAKYTWSLSKKQWNGTRKYEVMYDEKGNRVEYILYAWSSSVNEWVYSTKEKSTYDKSGNMVLLEYYNWKSDLNDWVCLRKKEYQYDDDGKQSVYVESLFTGYDGKWQWKERTREEYSYDESGKKIEAEVYYSSVYDDSVLKLKNKYLYEYDERGNQTVEKTFVLKDEEVQDSWMLVYERMRTYDDRGNMIKFITLSWNSDLEDYFKCDSMIISFDEENRMLQNAYYKFNPEIEKWYGFYKQDSVFMETDSTEVCHSFGSVWNQVAEDWQSRWKKEKTFYKDQNYAFAYAFNWDNGWFPASTEECFYSEIPLVESSDESIPAVKTGFSDLIIYPNPATEGFYVKGLASGSLLTIMDMQGRAVLVTMVSDGDYVPVSELPKGIYMVMVGNTRTKLVVQ